MFELDFYELSKIEILRLIHLFVCLFGGVFLILVWYRARALSESLKQDLGLVFIACALFLWVAMDLYRFTGLMKPGYVSLVIKTFSAYNNAFFLASLPFFSHSFPKLKQKLPLFSNKIKWALFVLLMNIGFVFFYSMFWGEKQESSTIVNYFDFIYSMITYLCLGYAIISSFKNRSDYKSNFYYIAILLTILLITVQLGFAPFFKVTSYDVLSAVAFISQSLLIFVFLILAQAWIIDFNQQRFSEERNSLESTLKTTREQLEIAQHELIQIKSNIENLQDQNQHLEENLKKRDTTIKISQQIKELSERELEVLSLIDQSYLEIGKKLHIARETVITHKKNIESKLGISNKNELIQYAIGIGILKTNNDSQTES